MQKDHRQAARERLGTAGWIRFDNGFAVRTCVVVDLSHKGARLLVTEPHTVDNQFSLLMRREAVPGRRCRVVWRNGREIGAEFV
jgi:hypothetical protein